MGCFTSSNATYWHQSTCRRFDNQFRLPCVTSDQSRLSVQWAWGRHPKGEPWKQSTPYHPTHVPLRGVYQWCNWVCIPDANTVIDYFHSSAHTWIRGSVMIPVLDEHVPKENVLQNYCPKKYKTFDGIGMCTYPKCNLCTLFKPGKKIHDKETNQFSGSPNPL